MHHEADKNSMNSCQLIPTHYMTNKFIINVSNLEPFPSSFFDTTLTTSVARAFGWNLSRDVAATGN